jgi:hypothetical protein
VKFFGDLEMLIIYLISEIMVKAKFVETHGMDGFFFIELGFFNEYREIGARRIILPKLILI